MLCRRRASALPIKQQKVPTGTGEITICHTAPRFLNDSRELSEGKGQRLLNLKRIESKGSIVQASSAKMPPSAALRHRPHLRLTFAQFGNFDTLRI